MRLVLVGWGAIAQRVAQLLEARSSNVTLTAIGARREPDRTILSRGIDWLPEPAALAGIEADMVIEAAGRMAVEPWGQIALRYAKYFAVSSASAFCEDGILDRLIAIAEEHGSRILIPPGALAGIDALAAASILPLDEVTHRIVKPPQAWRGTLAEQLIRLDNLPGAEIFFEGSARDAARQFPANANVAAITALAGIGLDRTRVQLVADPQATGNRHHLYAKGAFGTFDITIENRALATNPKSSELAALALVRLIENHTRALSLCLHRSEPPCRSNR